MSELVAAEQSDSGALVPQLIVLDNQVGLLSENENPVIRPSNLNNFESRVKPYVFNGASITPFVSQDTPPGSETPDEVYAAQFFEMLEIKADFQETDEKIIFENMISRVLFQCLLSGILGFVYNAYISEFSIYNKDLRDETINNLAFELLELKLCKTKEDMSLANPGESDGDCVRDDDYKRKAYLIDVIIRSLKKENTLTDEFRGFLGVKPSLDFNNFEQNYETLLEMVMRLGKQAPEPPESKNIRFGILKSVCKKIVVLLESVNFIRLSASGVYEIFEPIVSAAGAVASDNTTLAGRIKSLVILAAAYNSYGWLFAIIAPFAVPAAISIVKGTVTGTIKVFGKIATVPIKLIQHLGTGFGAKPDRNRPNRDPINKLICIGYTTKVLPDGGGILKVPYYISLNELLDLSYEIQSWEFAKRSLLSTMCIGHGVFDLGDWQRCDLPMEKQRLLRATHPLVTLFGYIADNFTDITTINDVSDSDSDSDDAPDLPPAASPSAAASYEYEYIDVISQQMFNVVANTMKENHLRKFAQTPMMKATFGMWFGGMHETASFFRSGIITCAKSLANSGPFEMGSDSDSDSDSGSRSVSSDSSVNTMTSRIVTVSGSEVMTINIIPRINHHANQYSPPASLLESHPVSGVSEVTDDSNKDLNLQVSISTIEAVATDVARDVTRNVTPAASAAEYVPAASEDISAASAPASVASRADVESAVGNLFTPEFISYGLNLQQRVETIVQEVAEAKIRARADSNEMSGGYRRKHNNMMRRDAAKMQNKLVSQHRTVNNQKVMQYMPEHDINQRKFVKGRKSKNYRNKKQKTKKRNKKQFKKRQTKKVLRKRRTTKKRYAMNKN